MIGQIWGIETDDKSGHLRAIRLPDGSVKIEVRASSGGSTSEIATTMPLSVARQLGLFLQGFDE